MRHGGCFGARPFRGMPATEGVCSVAMRDDEAPYEGGSQPVREHPPEVPGPGRSTMHFVVLALCAMVVLASAMWLFR